MAYVKLICRNLSRLNFPLFIRRCSVHSKEDAIDWDYYTNPSNLAEIESNIKARKWPFGHWYFFEYFQKPYVLEELLELITRTDTILICKKLQKQIRDEPVRSKLLKEALAPVLFWFPNKIHPRVAQNESEEPVTMGKRGDKVHFTYEPSTFKNLTEHLNVLRKDYLGNMSGSHSYVLKGDLALLEQALMRFTLLKLRKNGFQMISVPDIVPKSFLKNCGMRTKINLDSQVYNIHDSWAPDLCLAGTSEMALASFLSDEIHDVSNLPIKLCAVSRCYRAKAKDPSYLEKEIHRVHCFTKVEMFGITSNESGEESESLLKEFTSIQKELFTDLGLHFKIQEMPPTQLGLPAYHRITMEAWIPTWPSWYETEHQYVQISSASNCTDYQSRRIGIEYNNLKGDTKFCHTVNATACAIPRLLIAIFENFQNLDGSVNIPKPLQKYMKKEVIKGAFKETIVSTKPTP